MSELFLVFDEAVKKELTIERSEVFNIELYNLGFSNCTCNIWDIDIASFLNLNILEYRDILYSYNGFYYESITRFINYEDVKKALEWASSIMIANKLIE